MDNSNISQIPFGKFFDLNGEDKELLKSLILLKFEEFDPMEPDFFYLLEDTETGKYYGVHEPGAANHDDDFNKFIGAEYKLVKEIKPKNKDWFQTHWIFEYSR